MRRRPVQVEPEVDRPDFWGVNSSWYSIETQDWDKHPDLIENWDGCDDGVLDNIPLWPSSLR